MADLVYLMLWVTGLGLDVYSTWRFYREAPKEFLRREGSMIMRGFYRILRSFWRSVAAFILFFEAPLILLLAFICMPALSDALGVPRAEPLSLIWSAAALIGLFHLEAAATNLIIEVSSRKSKAA